MESLTSFAISFAAGIALDKYNTYHGTVKKDIEKAFENALKKWSVNPVVISNNRNIMRRKMLDIFDNPDLLVDIRSTDSELNIFLNKFEEALAESKSAYKFINNIKTLERFKQLIVRIEIINDTAKEIKDTVKEINERDRNIEHGVYEIIRTFNDNIPNKSTILESEWKRQIALYKENIDKLKPKTALELLNKLENSYNTDENKPSNVLVANIEFLKAQCNELLGNIDDVYKSYIKAYKLDPTSVVFMEKACYSYFKIEDNEKAKKLLNELLVRDDYNYMAWAVKVIMSDDDNLGDILDRVPKPVTKYKNFKSTIYFNTRAKTKYTNLYDVYDKYSILPDTKTYDDLLLTFDSYWDKVFLLETSLNKLLQTFVFDITKAFVGNIDLFKECKYTIDIFLDIISESEITVGLEEIKFYKYYFDFVLTENIESVNKMKEQYIKLETTEELLLLIIVNCLQLTKQEDEAIRIINAQDNKNIQSIMLESFCYLKKEDFENYIIVSHEYIENVKKVDEIICGNFLCILNSCKHLGLLERLDIEFFFKDKVFDNDNYKIIIEELYNVFSEKSTDRTLSNLKFVEENFLSTESKFIFYIAYSYYLLDEVELSIKLFKQFIDKENDIRNIYHYILVLDKAKTHNSELLLRLEKWRKDLIFNADLLAMELNLRVELSDWKKCIEISNYFLSQYPLNEDLLVCKLSALNKLNKIAEIKKLVYVFSSLKFKNATKAIHVGAILIENKYYEEALEIIYNAVIYSNDPKLRIAYFSYLINMPEELIVEKEVVEIGDFIKYSINGVMKYIEAVGNSYMVSELLGTRKGDVINLVRSMTKKTDSIRVERIMNKYLYLNDVIIDEVDSNPYSGMPMESIEFDTTSLESMNKTIAELNSNNNSEEHKKIALEEYYNYKLSFTEVIYKIYNSEYLGGYFDLIYRQKGIVIYPIITYPKNIFEEEKEIVIDLSSLPIFYQIHCEHNVNFKHKFIIGKSSVESIRNFLRKEKMEPEERISLSVLNGDVIPHKITSEETNANITYLTNLIEWIELYCLETIVEEKLDITRSLDKNIEWIDKVIENSSLVGNDTNRILVSDDSIYFKFFDIKSGKIASSEYYLRHIDPDYCSLEFIKNRYIGNLISLDNLLSEYKRKLNGQPNQYSHCFANMRLLLNPSVDTINVLIRFFKQVAIEGLMSKDEFKEEAKKAILNLIKGHSNDQSYLFTYAIINREFENHEDIHLLMLASYNEALLELGVDFNSLIKEFMHNAAVVD